MIQDLITAIVMVVLGSLAASSLIIEKKPEAKDLIDKLRPFQGWIGIIAFVWGVWAIIGSIGRLGWLSHYPISWITYFAVGVLQVGLGFILGWGLFSSMAFKDKPDMKEKGEAMLAKLRGVQTKLGLAGILLGAWTVVLTILYYIVKVYI